jgi:formyl-CoA transferase
MLEVLGRPELADDPRFRNNGERNTNRDALTEVLTALTRDWQCDELSDKLLAAGIPAGPVNNLGEVLDHEHTRHRGMVVEKDGYRGVGPPVKLSRTAATIRLRPAAFAADNVSVLTEAGYTEAEIETLISAGAVINERRR